MKRAIALMVACLSLVAGAANPGIVLYPNATAYDFTDCAAGGSASQTVTPGTYLFAATTEDVWVCYATTCATGGRKFPAGVVFMLSVVLQPGAPAGQPVSCRSTGATGDIGLTRASEG